MVDYGNCPTLVRPLATSQGETVTACPVRPHGYQAETSLKASAARKKLRVIPTLKHYSGLVSDTPSGNIHTAYLFWHSIWHSIWYLVWHTLWHIFWHSFWHSTWHLFWHSIWHLFRHSFWHSFWHLAWHSLWHSFWHSTWHLFWQSSWHSIWHSLWHLAEVRKCPLRSGARGWGPAMPTELWSCCEEEGGREGGI